MKNSEKIAIKTLGVSRLTMKNEALSPTYFGVDEHSLSDLMNYLSEYAKYVQFVNSENELDGNWSVFFQTNIAFLLAEIAVYDTAALEQNFVSISSRMEHLESKAQEEQLRDEIIETNYFLFKLIDDWYKGSKKDPEHLKFNEFYAQLNGVIRSEYRYHAQHFISIVKSVQQKGNKIANQLKRFDRFDSAWGISELPQEAQKPSHFEASHGDIKSLAQVLRSLISLVIHLKENAPRQLDNFLTNYPNHDAHISLIISFLKSFRHVQQDANDFMRKHLEYYLKEVLQQQHRNPLPDQVHLVFDPADHVLKSSISNKTILLAGADEEGLDNTYALDHEIEINRASIDQIKVVHVANNELIGIGKLYKDISNIYSADIHLSHGGWVLDQAGNPKSSYLFGRDQANLSFDQKDMSQAELGFAITSSTLLLAEGQRTISFTLKFQLKSLSSLISFVEEISETERISADSALHKILTNIFKVRVTTEKGWYNTESYEIVRNQSWTDGEIQINLGFDIAEPAIVAYDSAIHGEGFDTAWPIVEFTINSEKAMYSYSYIKALMLVFCRIDVAVERLRNITVFNDLGPVDTNTPFYPFGSAPELGAYFLIGSQELYQKSLTELSMDVQWHNLPRQKGGFKTYYKEYRQKISNDSFKLKVTGLSDYQFHPKNESIAQEFNLFGEESKTGILDQTTKFEAIDLKKIKHSPSFAALDVSEYSSLTQLGFIKFELTSPDMGFGGKLFPNLFSEAAIQNAKVSSGILGQKEPTKVDLPNDAFAPQIRTISLNYKASSILNFNSDAISDNLDKANEKLIHIHPFGKEVIFEKGLPQKENLIGQYEDEGYLYLGLKNLELPATLSLYFELEQNNLNAVNYSNIPQLTWYYLVRNEWIRFEDSDLITDTTNDFTTSGIIQLKIPASLDTKHTVMPENLYWLSVRAENNTHYLSKIAYVKTNGAQATWVQHKEGVFWEQNIDPNSISGFQATRPEIKEVLQPFSSFGGLKAETDEEFYFRISERLKNKNRLVCPSDYERWLLSKYPGLFQVMSFNHTIAPDFVKPGEVKIVLVPTIKSKEFSLPRVGYNELNIIEKELATLASPFSKIQVINPVYETVRVNCTIQFENQSNSGEYVKRLKTELRRFICPWFGTEQGEMEFGGSIDHSLIFSFLDSLSYVKFVTGLSVVVLHDLNGHYSLSDSASTNGLTNRISSSTPWSVLVPDENHELKITNRLVNSEPQETSIESMQVGSYFVIADDADNEVKMPAFNRKKDVFYSIEFDI